MTYLFDLSEEDDVSSSLFQIPDDVTGVLEIAHCAKINVVEIVGVDRSGRVAQLKRVVTDTGGNPIAKISPESIVAVLTAPVKSSSEHRQVGYALVFCEIPDGPLVSLLRSGPKLTLSVDDQTIVATMADLDRLVMTFIAAIAQKSARKGKKRP